MKLDKLTKKELMDIAAKKEISGRTKMSKPELIEVLTPLLSETSAVSKAKKTDKSKKDGASEANVGYEIGSPKKEVFQIKSDEYPIPSYYNEDTLVLMPVDPAKEYMYWEISDFTLNKFKSELRLSETRLVLKMFSQYNSAVSEVASAAVERMGSWYFNVYAPETVLWSEIGLIDSNGAFHRILKSRILKMPADKVSDIVDRETWLSIGGDLEKLYQLSGVGKKDNGSSKTIQKELAKQISEHMGSSNLNSSGDR